MASVAVGAALLGVGMPLVSYFFHLPSDSALSAMAAVPLLVAGAVTSWYLYDTLASPLGLFSVAWEGGMALAGLKLVDYVQISYAAQLMLHGSFIAFLIATAALGRHSGSGGTLNRSPWIGRILLSLGTLGVAMALYRLQTSLGVLAIFTHPTALRIARVADQFDSGLPSYLRILLIAAGALLPARSRETIALLGVAALWSLLSSERVFVLLVVVTLAVSWLISERSRLNLQHLTIATGLAVFAAAVFIVGGDLLGKEKGMNDMVRATSPEATVLPPAAVAPYVYLTGGYVDFGVYTDTVSPSQLGLDAVVTPLTRLHGHKENIFYEFRKIPFEFNLYTYLRSWYDAFGVAGTLLGPALFGLLSSLSFRRRGQSLAWYYACSILTVGILGGVFNPWLSYISFFGLLAIAPLLPSSAALVDRLLPTARLHAGARSPDDTRRSETSP